MTLIELRKYLGDRIQVKEKNCCWIWLRYCNQDGYGTVSYKGKKWLTHRLSFFFRYGYKPKMLDHIICDTPACCNPEHVTPSNKRKNANRSLKHKESARKTFQNQSPQWKANVRRAFQNKSPEWIANARKACKAKRKLTDEQIHRIKKKYRYGSRTRGSYALGREYGVDPHIILKAVHVWEGL